MEPKRTLYSGNLVRSLWKLFMEKYYDPEKYMELGTCFDGRKKNELENSVGRLQKFQSKISYRRRGAQQMLLSLYWQEESFQILKVEDKEENFSFMEKESHNTIKNSAGL